MAKPVLALRGLLVTWVLMFLVATLGWAMTGVFAGQAWRIYFAGPGIGMCALLGILRLCGVPRLLVPLAGLVAMLFLATALFDGNTSVGGWLPTGQTLAHWSDLFAQANDLIVEASSPAPFSGAMAFVTAIGVCLLAVVLDLLALGFGVPALAGLVALAALVIPAGVVPEGLSFAAVAMVGVAVGLLCWSGTRPLPLPWALPSARRPGVSGRRRRRAALARGAAVVTVVTVAAAGSWWLAGQVPGLTHGPLVDALPKVMIFANGPDPLVDLGEDLTERTRKKALTVTTDRQFAPPYLRMMTVDDFSGDQWTHLPETVPSVAQATDGSLQLPSRFPPGLLGLRQDQTMTIDVSDMQSAWLPVPEYPTDVRGLSGQWQAQASDGTIRADRSQTRGQRFNVLTGQLDREAFDAVVRMVLPERIGVELSQSRELHCGGPLLDEVEGWTSQTPVIPEEVQPYLALPDDLPELIRQSAEEARWLNFGGLDWPVQIAADCQIYQAYALQDYFRNPQRFVYSTSLPDDQGFNNGGSQAVAAFLRAGSGYCVQFASAMALMARLLGIPARVALGFAPADQAEQTNDGRVIYTYTTRDLHAWPELYIPNLGWLSFEPTPGRGVTETPSNNPPALPSNDPQGQSAKASPTASPSAKQSTTQTPRPSITPNKQKRSTTSNPINWRWLWLTAVILGLLSTPAWWRIARRQKRCHRLSTAGGLAAAWAEITDTVRDYHLANPQHLTAQELANQITAAWPAEAQQASANLANLVQAVEEHAYSQTDNSTGLNNQLRGVAPLNATALSEMLSQFKLAATRPQRWRARIAPASLFTKRLDQHKSTLA